MRYVQLCRLGTPSSKGAEIFVPYNGDEFEFMSPEWLSLARRAAATEGGKLTEDGRFAHVFDRD